MIGANAKSEWALFWKSQGMSRDFGRALHGAGGGGRGGSEVAGRASLKPGKRRPVGEPWKQLAGSQRAPDPWPQSTRRQQCLRDDQEPFTDDVQRYTARRTVKRHFELGFPELFLLRRRLGRTGRGATIGNLRCEERMIDDGAPLADQAG